MFRVLLAPTLLYCALVYIMVDDVVGDTAALQADIMQHVVSSSPDTNYSTVAFGTVAKNTALRIPTFGNVWLRFPHSMPSGSAITSAVLSISKCGRCTTFDDIGVMISSCQNTNGGKLNCTLSTAGRMLVVFFAPMLLCTYLVLKFHSINIDLEHSTMFRRDQTNDTGRHSEISCFHIEVILILDIGRRISNAVGP
jgi:hypothetical protein